jgi:hypothetical protein
MSKIRVGDMVDYHSVIGREVTSTGHTVTALYPKPNDFGCDCATITGKAGVVAVAALTPSPALDAGSPALDAGSPADNSMREGRKSE